MLVGEQMAASRVTIIDGPVLGDYAYQPVSANGMPRQTVEILKDGILLGGLADLFSAKKVGVPVTGAERIESYRNLPVPRMTNIRISVANPIPFNTRFEMVSPEELREVLLSNGLMKPDESVLYLSGYKGGQVNPKDGDFVFNCACIYALNELDNGQPKLYQPAIFSGKVLSALHSILAGIGPILLDAQGQCGKNGQSVPSSGGANMVVVIDRNENVTIGGD
jgi:TldD protein